MATELDRTTILVQYGVTKKKKNKGLKYCSIEVLKALGHRRERSFFCGWALGFVTVALDLVARLVRSVLTPICTKQENPRGSWFSCYPASIELTVVSVQLTIEAAIHNDWFCS